MEPHRRGTVHPQNLLFQLNEELFVTVAMFPRIAGGRYTVGQLEIFQFVNPQGLNQLGGSIYTQTESSGPALQSKPGENGAGQILQGFLESSAKGKDIGIDTPYERPAPMNADLSFGTLDS